MTEHWQELSTAGKAFVLTMGARLVFGLYLALNDHFNYRDTGSAVTVLGIYALLAVFTAMFLCGRRPGLYLALGLSAVLILAHTAFTVMDLANLTDSGPHSVYNNPWPTALRYLFFLATFGLGARLWFERHGPEEVRQS